jgi:hypothetical protein
LTAASELHAALREGERLVSMLRRLVAEAEQRETTREFIKRESDRDLLEFDRVAGVSNG